LEEVVSEKYRNHAQQRILRVLLCLGGHEVNGLAPTEIANALSINQSTVTRDLANLSLAGVAEPIQGSTRWRLSPRVPQIALAMLDTIAGAGQRLDEVRNRYTRLPR
jgi:DNA-binding IclR family transcriptional regulator